MEIEKKYHNYLNCVPDNFGFSKKTVSEQLLQKCHIESLEMHHETEILHP